MTPDKTRVDLELDRVLSALAERCASSAGKRTAVALPFLETRAEVVRALGEIDEAKRLDDRGEPLPHASLPEVAEAIARARVSANMSAEEVRALLRVLLAVRALRKFLKAHPEEAPLLAAACETDPALDQLASELDRSFDEDGTISDAASPKLAELRAERRTSRERIVRRLGELVARYASIMSDAFWTERDGRYVLPIRADAHERFPGIVHGASSGGATLFVEPRVIIPMGNRHKVLDSLVEREEEIVVAALAAMIAAAIDSVAAAVDALAHADLRAACAKLAVALKLTTPQIPEGDARSDMRIELIRARHPLLVLDGVDAARPVAKLAAREPLLAQPEALPVVRQDLDRRPAPIPEHEHRTRERRRRAPLPTRTTAESRG